MLPPLAALGRPSLPTTDADLRTWRPWAAAVLGALAALEGPLGDAPPEELRVYFHPLVAGAAVLLAVVHDECQGVAVAWDAVALDAAGVCVRYVDGRAVRVRDLERLAPAGGDEAWLTALLGLVQVTLQVAERWPDLRAALPPALRLN